MSERSVRLVPDDPRTHTERINDWVGSHVFVQYPRRDVGDTPMPEGKTFKYILKASAFDGSRLIRPGEIVELTAGQVGPHHQPIDGEKYDADHKAAIEFMNQPRKPAMVEETIPLSHHQQAIAALQEENATLKAAIDKEATAAAKDEAKKP